MRLPKPGEIRKLLVFVATVLANALVLGLVPEAYVPYSFLVLNTLGGYGIWRLPNDKPLVTKPK